MGYHSRCRPEPAMRVQAQLTPCEYSEYPTEREYRMRPRQEYAGSITRPPERPIPSGHSDAHSADATAFTSALRFRAARSPAAANGTGTTADAAPGTPPAHAGTPSTLPGTVPRGISIEIPCDVGTRPGLGCIATRRGETVPRALGVLGREGTLRTLAVLGDLMQVLTVPRVLRVPNVRTTDRDVDRQLYCPM